MASHTAPVEPLVALLGLPQPSTEVTLVAIGVILTLFAAGAYVTSRPVVKTRVAAAYDRAFAWIDRAITAWHVEGRITDAEAERLRTELREPDFVAVLPHFGVHLTIGVFLRFPFGSITRGLYVLANMVLAHVRLATRRIDGHTFRQQMGIHSPIVLLLTCLPGIGTFAYLASKPFRTHHLLARVALDAVLLKLPKHVYERAGARPILAHPAGWSSGSDPDESQRPGLRVRIVPARIVALLAVIAIGLFAIDVGFALVEEFVAPGFLGWEPIMRVFDLNAESSIGTWFAVLTLVLVAALLGIIALGKRASGDRYAIHWAGLAVIALGLSIDEQAKLHDLGSGFGAEMRERLGLGGGLYYGWVIVAAATILAIAMVYWRFVLALPRDTRTPLIIAAGFYLAGEMGMEMIGGWIMDRDGATLAYSLASSVEEFLGLAGVVIAFGALLAYARGTVGTVELGVKAFDPKPAPSPTVTALAILPEPERRPPEPVGATVQ